ncbi:MAG: hypothetical protein KTR35_01670 [Gammaproteobacteria bacterium]|nr:hypothetical protein [Gammaproteobacteria bacterium]
MAYLSNPLRAGLACLILMLLNPASSWAEGDTDCQCRDSQGSMQNLGTVMCVDITGNQYLVRCEMSQNTPYWKRVNEQSGCPQANLSEHLKGRLTI